MTNVATPKERFRTFFRALHVEARHAPGGIEGIAAIIGRNPQVLRNQLNPDNLADTPSASTLLEVFEQIGGCRSANALAWMVGYTAVPVHKPITGDGRSLMVQFLDVINKAGQVMQDGTEALADGVLSQAEREQHGALLDELIAVAVAWRANVRG